MPQQFEAFTLVDITDSGVTNSRDENVLGYNQNQNLNTLLQLISMRSQPIDFEVTKLEDQPMSRFRFGSSFKNRHTVWKLTFFSEHDKVYEQNEDPIYFLWADCDGAAFTRNLTETAGFDTSTFETLAPRRVNLYFNLIG